MRRFGFLAVSGWVLLLVGCVLMHGSPVLEPTLSPNLASGTALVGRKLTQAAELTLWPPTPEPTEPYPTIIVPWTPGWGEIIASDSGKTVDVVITGRVSVILDEQEYPRANLVEECRPQGVLGEVSNLPVVPPNFYVVRYEGVQPGQCTIRNGSFEVTIRVVNPP